MGLSSEERFAGVEDEFRITNQDGGGVLLDELVRRSERFFFNEADHVQVVSTSTGSYSSSGRIWSWYGGTLYHDYDATGSLIEATTPLTLLTDGVCTLVNKVVTQRAQILELCDKCQIVGVSTHLNITLDSLFAGDDLCRFEVPVPSDTFVSVSAQKLGADIALLASQTVSPVIALLLFNRKPKKGALYRPRRNRRMELCLPFVTEPSQMRVGFAFWFAVVDHITKLIKEDLQKHSNWQTRFQSPEYYRNILPQMPVVIQDIRYQKPSYVLGYQLESSLEQQVMERGSNSLIPTDQGEMNILDLANRYAELLEKSISFFGGDEVISTLSEYIGGRRTLNVDIDGTPRFFSLSNEFVEITTGLSTRVFLKSQPLDNPASIYLKFLQSPCRLLNAYSRRLPMRLIRNIGTKIGWNHITLEIIEEDEFTVKQHLLEVPLSDVDEYFSAEDYSGTPYWFLAEIGKWTKAVNSIPNPRAVFAYGTLMSAEQNSTRFGAVVTTVQDGHAYGEAFDFGDFPVMLDNPDGGIVPGVLISMSNFEDSVARFDQYEGCNEPNPIFFRVIRDVMVQSHMRKKAWIYVGNANNNYVAGKLLRARRMSSIWTKKGFRREDQQIEANKSL